MLIMDRAAVPLQSDPANKSTFAKDESTRSVDTSGDDLSEGVQVEASMRLFAYSDLGFDTMECASCNALTSNADSRVVDISSQSVETTSLQNPLKPDHRVT